MAKNAGFISPARKLFASERLVVDHPGPLKMPLHALNHLVQELYSLIAFEAAAFPAVQARPFQHPRKFGLFRI
jgi:hypothetical protein